jgi:hypothetical protein
MNRSVSVLTALLIVLWSILPAGATTVEGSLTYAGLPLSDTFDNLQSALIQMYNADTGTGNTYIVQAGDSYQIPEELSPGQHAFWIMVSPRSGVQSIAHLSGDLSGASGTIDVPDQASFTLDFEMRYSVFLTQPLDSTATWPGNGCDCPIGALQPHTFTFAWEPVPHAVRYNVQAFRFDCTEIIHTDVYPATGLSMEISQRQVEGEDSVEVSVVAYDAQDRSLAVMPLIFLRDGCDIYGAFYTIEDGRSPHSMGSTIAQVAHAQGVGQSYWTTDLTLTNPTASAVTTPLIYTPRGVDGLIDYQEAEVTVPAGACRTYKDVVSALFGDTGAGALEVSSSALIVASRTGTPASGGGSYGQGVVPISAGQILDEIDDEALGGGVIGSSSARCNLALNEVWGEPATVRVELLDRDGNPLGSRSYSLMAYGNTQINDLVATLGRLSNLVEGQVRVRLTSGSGHIAATLFLVDASDDPSTVPLLAQ